MGSLQNDKFYAVGEPEQYGSIYGYSKYRYPVYEVDEKGERINETVIGLIKEEIMKDEDGEPVAKAYYTRNLNRPHGLLRFYPTPRALIVAFGGKVPPRFVKKRPAKTSPAKPQRKSAVKKRVKKVA